MIWIKICGLLMFPAGILNGIIAATSNNHLTVIITGLTAVITVALGCFITAFIRHIADHVSKGVVTSEVCSANVKCLEAKIDSIRELIEACSERHHG